jgi:hypothetical protein
MPQKGTHFISDRDARNPGGMHPNAHLWDNGNDPVNELKNVMKVRSKALSQFGQNNIRKHTNGNARRCIRSHLFISSLPNRSCFKSGWWLILFLCRKGDGQMITRSVTKEEQLNALNAITDCIDPKCWKYRKTY